MECITKFQTTQNKQMNKIMQFYLQKIKSDIGKESIYDSLHSMLFLAEIYNYLEETNVWDKIIFEKWKNVQEKSQLMNHEIFIRYGLFNGLSEVCLIADLLHKNTGNYQKLRASLHNMLLPSIQGYAKKLYQNINNLSAMNYDCINGAAGVLRYLIDCPNPNTIEKAKYLIKYFIEVINCEDLQQSGWHIKNKNLATEEDKEVYPQGVINFSLSHGIAGPLAVLSLSLQKGICVPGQKDAVKTLCEKYFFKFQTIEQNIPYWPGQLAYEKYQDGIVSELSKRMSWCYGSIGVLRALQIYSQAVEDKELEKWTNISFEHISMMPIEKYLLTSPTICHGLSGMLVTLAVVNRRLQSEIIQRRIQELYYLILEHFDDKTRYGFINIDYKYTDSFLEKMITDDASFLTGSTGVLLSLLSVIQKDTEFEKHLLII